MRHQRRGLVGPVLLILIGGAVLLNNLGVTSIPLWDALLRLWPVILMAIGIDLIVPRRSIWGTLLTLVLIVGLFALAYVGLRDLQPAAAAERIELPFQSATSANLTLKPAVGSVEVGGGAAAGLLVDGSVVPLSGEQIDSQVQVQGGVASATVESSGSSGGFLVLPSSRGRWDLALTGSIPLTLRANMGVGTMSLDLSSIHVEEVAAEIGVGRLEVHLPAEARTQVRLKGGIGVTIVWLPAGARAQIEAVHDLAGLSLPQGAVERDGFIFTGGATAEDADLHLAIEQSIGSISIRQR